jgi:hypothetical protein
MSNGYCAILVFKSPSFDPHLGQKFKKNCLTGPYEHGGTFIIPKDAGNF